MLKIFLAEDEYVIRNGIRNRIDWKAAGYEFVGDAADGEMAWPQILAARPDIVITDIKMPFMDGLELSRLIRKELPETEIIVLTGHEEFDYARQALNLGVAKYLLKPVNAQELLAEIDDLAERIEEKRRHSALRSRYEADMAEKALADRREFFRVLVTGTGSVSELLGQAGKLSIDLSAAWYNVVLLRVWSTKHAPDEFSRSIVEIGEQLEALRREDAEHLILFDRALEGKALLCKAASEAELAKIQLRFTGRFADFLKKYPYVRWFGGIGTPVQRLSEMPASFEAAGRAMAHRFLYPHNLILDSAELETAIRAETADPLDLRHVDPSQVDRRRVREFLLQGDPGEVNWFIEDFFSGLAEDAKNSLMFRNYIVLNAWFCVLDVLNEAGVADEAREGLREPGPDAMKSTAAARAYLTQLLLESCRIRQQHVRAHYTEAVEEALRYIRGHYADEDLSLNVLASKVNVSPNHLSTLFSQQTGRPFIRYLTELRMEKAKELLRGTDLKTGAIAQQVGYQDPHYFSYLFRKTVGMPPTQYRQGS